MTARKERQGGRSAADFLPEKFTIPELQKASRSCEGCDLYKRATQTVFGEGSPRARIMLVGEQPGDKEDLEGRPFVGPAGRILAQGLTKAGIPRENVYVTNAVKHFKWIPRGKRRIHDKPRMSEIEACRPWLEAEIAVIKPLVVICLGATAARALMGPKFRLMENRGRVFEPFWAPWLVATVHPSSLLRLQEHEERMRAFQLFVADLKKAASLLGRESKSMEEAEPVL
ncbi:MAG: UdgX family uracil-DNA binding protein [Acidobacteria bacterium]|nr:UdgX family uracil-DNA binding protein [Acidobacteriota bacterium]